MTNNVKLILRDGDFAIYKTEEHIGGSYAVVNLKDRTAKSGCSLDAAYDIFKVLTLEAELKEKGMI